MNTLKKLNAPISVNLEATDRCNLKCFFCFCATEAYQNSLSPLSNSEKTENIRRILEILSENNIFEVRLFGGEFSLLKGWKEIIEYANKLNFFISFVSNGTLFNEEDIEFIANQGIKNCSISIHGLDDLHDQIVGRSESFKKASKNVQLLSEKGVKVSVPFTPNERNILHLENFSKTMIKQYGASSVGINRLFQGDQYENLTFRDYEYIFEKIWQLQNIGLPVYFIDSFPRCKIPSKYWPYMSNCSQGMAFCQIDYMGNIKNCSSLSVNIGNIFQRNIQEIWKNELSQFRTLKHLPLSCRLCPFFCGGGCIASRTIKKNFVADEFIKLPEEETFFESMIITGQNYIKKWLNSGKGKPAKTEKKTWTIDEIPAVTHKYKTRKETVNSHLCMVEDKGVIILNELSLSILNLIDGKNSVKKIKELLSRNYSTEINYQEIEEILEIFC